MRDTDPNIKRKSRPALARSRSRAKRKKALENRALPKAVAAPTLGHGSEIRERDMELDELLAFLPQQTMSPAQPALFAKPPKQMHLALPFRSSSPDAQTVDGRSGFKPHRMEVSSSSAPRARSMIRTISDLDAEPLRREDHQSAPSIEAGRQVPTSAGLMPLLLLPVLVIAAAEVVLTVQGRLTEFGLAVLMTAFPLLLLLLFWPLLRNVVGTGARTLAFVITPALLIGGTWLVRVALAQELESLRAIEASLLIDAARFAAFGNVFDQVALALFVGETILLISLFAGALRKA
jgi:hypothetical protein